MLDYQRRNCRRTSAHEGRRVADCPRPPVTRTVASLSLLWRQQAGLIFRIHIYFRDAGLWTGMVGRCVPNVFEQLHPAEFLQRNAAPVCRRPRCLQSAAALASILVAQHTSLAVVIPAQSVRAEPPFAAMIGGPDGTFANYRRSDQSINFLDRLNPCPDNTHPLHNTRPLPGTAMDSIIYNTVILVP